MWADIDIIYFYHNERLKSIDSIEKCPISATQYMFLWCVFNIFNLCFFNVFNQKFIRTLEERFVADSYKQFSKITIINLYRFTFFILSRTYKRSKNQLNAHIPILSFLLENAKTPESSRVVCCFYIVELLERIYIWSYYTRTTVHCSIRGLILIQWVSSYA